ncbi:MAG: hypothetical protein SEPTF4163_003837 [Sporothrix epigloea]
MTGSGLNTVNLSQMTTWQQVILFLLIISGSSIWVSIWTIAFRKHVLEKRLYDITDGPYSSDIPPRKQMEIEIADGVTPLPSQPSTGPKMLQLDTRQVSAEDLTGTKVPGQKMLVEGPVAIKSTGAEAHADNIPVWRAQAMCGPGVPPVNELQSGKSLDHLVDSSPFEFLSRQTLDRNAQFHGLTREEREKLGGCEYRALKLLFAVVPLYFLIWQLFGCIALGSWINYNMSSVATGNGINPWWLGIFNGASAFNNSGMSLLDANMIPFEKAHFVIVTMGLMILAGNTAYPVFLRLIFWTMLKVLRWITSDDQCSEAKATIGFILQYPRRVYTNLFPSRPTWWLLFMIVLLNCIDWVAFELLNLENPVVDTIPTGSRILDGLFQAIGT